MSILVYLGLSTFVKKKIRSQSSPLAWNAFIFGLCFPKFGPGTSSYTLLNGRQAGFIPRSAESMDRFVRPASSHLYLLSHSLTGLLQCKFKIKNHEFYKHFKSTWRYALSACNHFLKWNPY